MTIYLKFGGIKGPVTTDGFKDWIECRSFQWHVKRHIGTAARGSSSREHSEPTISEVTITKRTDLSSPKLLLDAMAGKLDNKVIIKFTTTAKGKVETFLTYELEHTGVSAYSVHSTGDMPQEHVTLNYVKISETFVAMDETVSGSPETVGYDLREMKTI
jgi:type VI secretion system secreted protein Hcp